MRSIIWQQQQRRQRQQHWLYRAFIPDPTGSDTHAQTHITPFAHRTSHSGVRIAGTVYTGAFSEIGITTGTTKHTRSLGILHLERSTHSTTHGRHYYKPPGNWVWEIGWHSTTRLQFAPYIFTGREGFESRAPGFKYSGFFLNYAAILVFLLSAVHLLQHTYIQVLFNASQR
jgi:hypothetical protein